MSKIQTIIDLIKNNEIFSDMEKNLWMEILPCFDNVQQDEFYKILLQESKEYVDLKLKQKKININLKNKQKQEWKNLISQETDKTNKFIQVKIKELDEEKIKSILNKVK